MRNITFALIVAALISLVSIGSASYAENHTTPTKDGCGEAAGIEAGATYVDVCATQALAKTTSTPTLTATVKAQDIAEQPPATPQPAPVQIEQSGNTTVQEKELTETTQPSGGHSITNVLMNEDVTFLDSDGDGCADLVELGTQIMDPQNAWDNADLNRDGVVDATDAQMVAFRWGSELGDLLYNVDYNLEPNRKSYPFADNDIDINDLQYVNGRFGWTCPVNHTVPLSSFNGDCQGNFREASEEGEPAIPFGQTGCLVVRDSEGTIFSVTLVEGGSVLTGEAAAICTDCVGPGQSPSGDWFSMWEIVEKVHRFPGFDQVCAWGNWGCVSVPQTTLVRHAMHCSWNYFDGPPGHVYDGAVVDVNCNITIKTNLLLELDTLGDDSYLHPDFWYVHNRSTICRSV